MIDVLKNIEHNEILELLEKPEIWNSLDVDYHPPRVERIWCQHGDYRIYLHFIHPCKTEEALYHTHPWPSAMHIVDGNYEMGVGFAETKYDEAGLRYFAPRTVAKLILPADTYYDMTEPMGYHYVRPLVLCRTIMITGKPFEGPFGTFKPGKTLENLSDEKKEEIRMWFLNYYWRIIYYGK